MNLTSWNVSLPTTSELWSMAGPMAIGGVGGMIVGLLVGLYIGRRYIIRQHEKPNRLLDLLASRLDPNEFSALTRVAERVSQQ